MKTNTTLLRYPLTPEVVAFSTTRLSPFSPSQDEVEKMGNYAAFNVTHYCGDEPTRVARNRGWLCGELGINDRQLWLPHQTHTANVHCIDDSFLKLPKTEQTEALENIDALVTHIPHLCVGISTADCIPILLFDAPHHVVAAVHAGWRGTASRIVQNVLSAMAERYGTNASDCRAVIGPGIGVESFEVGEEVVEQFRMAHFPETIVSHPLGRDARPHIDLWAANSLLLEEMGVPLENIMVSGIDTYVQHDTFFSARRLGINSGRIFSGIMLLS